MKYLSTIGALLIAVAPAIAVTPEQDYESRLKQSWWPKPGTSFKCYVELEENGLFIFNEVLKESETSWEFFPRPQPKRFEFLEDKGGAWVGGADDTRLVRTQVGICHY
ncbi:hypothetical protein [Synechococcus sp. MIT S1220]|uniref:hypothetical protein n=1 Tax=Synechococcus sp. MIT S1220 TaxID=3082549 RepID=UPI0039AF5731